MEPSPRHIAPKVFISYSHDSPAHMDRVLELSNRLRRDGIDAILDQYETAPQEGWPKWMDRQIEESDFVLIVCTETYFNRVQGREKSGIGRGIKWESLLTYQDIYDRDSLNSKYIPVLLDGAEESHIPRPLRATDRYRLADIQEYEKLYRRITGQPLVVKPDIGVIRSLLPRQRQQSFKPPKLWNVPYERNPVFTGRNEILEALHANFQKNKKQALSGLGGIGKTQIAVEYAYRYRDEYVAVLWSLADSEQSANSGFAAIARLLDLSQKDSAEQAVITSAVKRWLDENDNWLVILDNADHPELLSEFLPQQHRGHVLLTSRRRSFQVLGIIKPQEVTVLSAVEAKEFLLKRTAHETCEDILGVDELAKELGYLALALEQAGAYILENQASFGDYLAGFRKRRLKLLEEQPPIMGSYEENEQKKTVATTWSINFSEVEKNPASADLLRLSVFLSPEKIPFELLHASISQLGEHLPTKLEGATNDPTVLDEVLKPLTNYSLICRNSEERSYSIHPLVQEVMKERMGPEARSMWAERTVSVVNSAFPDAEEFNAWTVCGRFIAHALTCTELMQSYEVESEVAARLLNQTGNYLSGRAQYSAAEPLLRRALEIRQKECGFEHPLTAASLHDLAFFCHQKGKFEEAEPLLLRAVAIREKVLGPGHRDTANSLNSLAGIYLEKEKYGKAEPLFRRALEIREKALGLEHPKTADSLNNLGGLYSLQSRYEDAEPLYRRSLEIREKVLGQEHPDTATGLNNLATLYGNQGNYGEAESLHRRALEIRERALGPEHPDTANSLNNLGYLYNEQSKYEDAELLVRRALEIREKTLGIEHPDTVISLYGMATLYKKQGKHGEAEPLYKRALEIREETLGIEHPATVSVFNSLALLYRSRGNKAAAEALQQRRQFKIKLQKRQRGKTKKKHR